MKIKNWKKFQHFKDRRPPWIKLHREILEQRDINTISDKAFRLLVNLWVLASEDEEKLGNLPEIIDIAYRLRKTEVEISELLQELAPWIDYSDIEVISPCQQPVPPETEAYKEEEEKEVDIPFDSFYEIWPKKKSREAAVKAWKKINNKERQLAIDAIPKHLLQEQWKDIKYIPNPATWLNGKMWQDDVEAAGGNTISPEALEAKCKTTAAKLFKSRSEPGSSSHPLVHKYYQELADA